MPPPRTILTAAALAAGAHALQLPSPPSAAGIFVVKSTASGTAILEEYLAGAPSQWYPLQSLTVTGCALSTAGAQGYGSVAADGTAAVFPCGATGSCARAVARVGASGTVDVTPSGWYTTTTCTFLPRGAATEDGNVTWAADAQAIYRGAFSAAASAIASGNTYYHALVAVLGGARALLVSGCAGTTAPCPSGSIYYSDPALPGSVDDSFNFPLAGVSVPAIGAFVVAPPAADGGVALYAGSDSTTASVGGLYRFVAPAPAGVASTWSPAAFGGGSAVRNPPGYTGVHGLTGRAEGGSYVLYLTTSAATGNALFRYDTAADGSSAAGAGYTLLVAAPSTARLHAALYAAPPPSGTSSPSGTPSGTPSNTASASASLSAGAAASATASVSASPTAPASASPPPSATASRSATISGTSTPTPTRPGHFRLPFAAPGSSLVVQRAPGAGGVLALDEFLSATPAQAAPRQSAPLQGNCAMATGPSQGFMSSTLTGGHAFWMCASALGTTARVVARLAPNGTVDYGVTLTTTQTTYAPRAATSLDGATGVWASDGRSLSYRASANGALGELTTVLYYHVAKAVELWGTRAVLVSACTTSSVPCTSGGIYYSTPFLPLNTTATFNRALTGLTFPGVGDYAFASSALAYVGSDSTVAGTGGLRKFTASSSAVSATWSASAFGSGTLLNPPGYTGVHGLVGRAEGGSYVLYLTTSVLAGGGGNALFRYDTASDSAPAAGAGFTALAAAPSGEAFLGLAFAPVVPSASPTPSNTRSTTPTPTPTRSATPSETASPSGTASVSASPSQSPEESPSPSATASVSVTPSGTGTPSRTASPGVSASGTATTSETASASASATPSATPSPSGTAEETPSTSVTASPTASVSATGSTSRSRSATPSRSGTPTPTPTRPGAFSVPLAPGGGSLVVQRVASTTAWLDEVALSGGAGGAAGSVRQTAQLPSNCLLAAGYAQGFAHASLDGSVGVFACAGAAASTARTIAALFPNGSMTFTTGFTTTQATYAPRGATTGDGSTVFAADGRGIWAGAMGSSLTTLDSVNYYFAARVLPVDNGAPGLLVSGCAGSGVPCPAGSGYVFYSQPLLPGVGVPAAYNLAVAGVAVPAVGEFVLAGDGLLYAGSDSNATGTGGLRKFSSSTGSLYGTWAAVPFGGGSAVRNPPGYTGVHGLTGRAEGGSYVLYLTTSVPSAATPNALFRYDTAADGSSAAGAGYTLVAASPPGWAYAGVLFAPAVPSATPTRSGTPSITPSSSATPTATSTPSTSAAPSETASGTSTPTASLSAGGSASGTATGTPSPSGTGTASPSGTPTPSVTPSLTPSPTGTATPTPTRPGAFPAPLAGSGNAAGGTLLVQRATGSATFLDEVNATTGEVRQSAQLQAGCTIPAGYASGLGGVTLNGGFAIFMCAAVGTTTRYVVRAAPSGALDYSTTLATSQTAYAPRTAASPDGVTAVYGIDARAMWYRAGVGGAMATLTTTYYYIGARMVTYSLSGNATLLVVGCTTSAVPCASSAVWYSTPFLPTATTGTTFHGSMPGLAIPAGTDILYASSTVVYAASDSLVAGTGGLRKFTSATATLAGTWSPAAFGSGTLLNPPGYTGVHALAGRTEGGSYAVYLTTSVTATTQNALFRYDTALDASLTAAVGFTLLATSPAAPASAFLGVMLAPAVPSASPTRSSTPSTTKTPTGTPSPTRSATGSASTTPSVSPSVTPSSSATPSATPSGSATVSPGVSASGTAAPTGSSSPSQTGTPSPSRTGSPTGSPSGTRTSTPTTTGTPTGTRSGTPTPSGTAASTPSRTGSATPTATTPGSFGSALGGGSVLVQRTAGSTLFLDEFDPPSGALRQSAQLPASCALGTAPGQGYGSNTADAAAAVFPCGPVGQCARVLARVGRSGTVDVGTSYTTSTCAFAPRGAAAVDAGGRWWATDARGVWTGGWGAPPSGAAVQTSGLFLYHTAVVRPAEGGLALLASGCASSLAPCPQGFVYYAPGVGLPANASAPLATPLAGVAVPAIGAFVLAPGGGGGEAQQQLFVAADTTAPGGGGGVYRFVTASAGLGGNWAPAPFGGAAAAAVANPPGGYAGAHGLVGRAEGAGYVLYVTTAEPTENALFRFAPATGEWALLAAAPTFYGFRAVFAAPLLPTVTPSASSTASATASPSGSRSATPPPTSSRTGTPSSSGTSTGSVSATPSETASVSSTSTPTSSVSASGTGTPSSSQTMTGTPSSSQTETGTPSGSSTGTGSASPSQTGTPTGTPPPSGSRTPAPTATRSPTPTKTKPAAAASPSRTKTRTATASRTKTRTRSRSPSKKKKLLR